jgi:hypothetical protein
MSAIAPRRRSPTGLRGRSATWAVAALTTLAMSRAFAGTIAEQRQRLPPPARCADPVAGVWRSHTFDERWGEWNAFTLHIRRDPNQPELLVGDIVNHSWFGDVQEVQPGACEGRLHYEVSMDALGTASGLTIEFGGQGSWRLDKVICGSFDGGYNLDHFSGTIDPALQEFQSVNNDGGAAVNVATVFRRTGCLEDPPHAPVDPPPMMPPASGCHCGDSR